MSGVGLFVGRDGELAELDRRLDAAMGGRGGVCFVVGEAGSGKTALVGEFVRRAQARHRDLIAAIGQSDAQTGMGDPFLPFREVLAQLTGDVDAELARGRITEEGAGRLRRFLGYSGQAIVDLGPDLIGVFVPGVGLATKAAAFVAEKSGRLESLEELTGAEDVGRSGDRGGIDQTHIFEQYTNVITRLAEQQPIVLVLDDLQWADSASIGLLFRLGRSIDKSRVLVVGTYRPADVALGRSGRRHPLGKVLAELKRYLGDLSVDLGGATAAERRRLVDGVLDSEPHRLGGEFRRVLFDHTGGHPLFTIELLRSLQERGDLIRDDHGWWIEGEALDWGALPARVEGVIEERIGRLSDDLLETLTVASVEGEDFTAEVVAQVRSTEARLLVRRLGRELEQQHRLVRSRGLRRLDGDGMRLSLFAFEHNLFQRYLYGTLNEADRAYLHEDVGIALEALCEACPDEFVVQLARHFDEAGIKEKAAAYLRRAGEVSLERYANDEAVDYFTRALALTPDSDWQARWDMLCARERALGIQGSRSAQERDLATLRHLADRLDDNQMRAETALRTATFGNATGDYVRAIAAAEQAIRFAASGRDIAREARAYGQWGMSLLRQGRHDEARARYEHALALAEGAALHSIQAESLGGLAGINLERGEFEEAGAGFREALRICSRLNDPIDETRFMGNLGIVTLKLGDLEGAKEGFEQVLARQRRMGDRRGEGISLHNLGEVSVEGHHYWAAWESYSGSLRIHHLTGDQRGECMTVGSLGSVAMKLGLYAEAAKYLERALEVSQSIGQSFAHGDAMAWLGELRWCLGEYDEACDYTRKAIDIVREIPEPLIESRSLYGLGLGLEGLEEWNAASDAYEESRVMRIELGQHGAAAESVSGLARVSLLRGDLAGAQTHVDRILAHLDVGNLNGTAGTGAVYLTCYRVLAAAGDPRAKPVLGDGYGLLTEQSDRITDPDVRRAFLEKVPAHRQILELVTREL